MRRGRHLVDVVEFQVFEEEEQQGRDGLDDDFFVAVDIDAQLHALEDRDAAERKKTHKKRRHLNNRRSCTTRASIA